MAKDKGKSGKGNDKQDSIPTKNDPWYGKFETSMGVEVSGGAALLSRIKELGGMSAVISKATAAGAMAAAAEIASNLQAKSIRRK